MKLYLPILPHSNSKTWIRNQIAVVNPSTHHNQPIQNVIEVATWHILAPYQKPVFTFGATGNTKCSRISCSIYRLLINPTLSIQMQKIKTLNVFQIQALTPNRPKTSFPQVFQCVVSSGDPALEDLCSLPSTIMQQRWAQISINIPLIYRVQIIP